MFPPIYLPTSYLGMGLTAVQSLHLLAFTAERENPTGYSKFADQKTSEMPSRQGMLIIYTPALVASMALLLNAPQEGRGRVVAALLAGHFAKRVGEVLFLHKYSGNMQAGNAYMVGVTYFVISTLVGMTASAVPPGFYEASAAVLPVALALFGVGQGGNLFHHYLLARMRDGKAADGSKYTIPRGGLFEYVATPHYFCEVLSWVGIALAAQSINAVLVALGMTSYLSGRAVATTKWNKEKFGEKYPSQRRHIIPFIF